MKKVSDTMTMQERLRELGGDMGPDEDYCITEQAAEIERLRAALQLIAADVTGNKHHQAQFRQDTACEALKTLDERTN